MNKEIILTPEELYYLGSFLQAKYIDYAYIAAMSDIKQNYKLFEKETRASLVSSGIIIEDFAGNIEIDESVRTLLTPIFFGETETSLDICEIGVNSSVTVYKFHFYDETITMVTGHQEKLIVKSIDLIEIQQIVEKLLPANYNPKSITISDIADLEVTRFIAAKSILVGNTSTVKTYIEAGNVLYQENEENIESISKEMFISNVCEIVKGA